MPQLQPFGKLLLAYAYGFIGVCGALLGMLVMVITKGPKRVFHIKDRKERPEILDSPEWGTHHFARLKNITLHYVENGPADKPLMLLLHGFPEFWFSWRHQLKYFSSKYRVVAVDMRGYAESEKPSGVSNYAMEILAADMKSLVHALGYEKCILGGHDWGANVAWTTAMLHPALVHRLFICNVGHPRAMQNRLESSFSQLKKSWYMFFFQYPYIPEMFLRLNDLEAFEGSFKMKSGQMSSEAIEAYKYMYRTYESCSSPINYYRAAIRYQHETDLIDKPIEAPTLVMWGTGDPYLEKELATESGKFVENLTVKFFEGYSHWLQQDAAQEVNKCIDDFLSA